MAELKTQPNDQNVEAFLNSVDNDAKRQDALTILEMMKQITGENPKMWGNSIIGFGNFHYKYESGREGDWFVTGFSPRKQNLTVYLMSGFEGKSDLLNQLGKHKIGKGCLYIKKLEDIQLNTLKTLIQNSVEETRKRDTKPIA